MNQKFIDLVRDQFEYGGQKYAGSETKEATDYLVEDFGWNWLFGTQAKYVKRFRNTHREKDLLKIATYFFIDWLKLGYHLSPLGTAEIQCTTVPVKSEFFPVFIDRTEDVPKPSEFEENFGLNRLYEIFLRLRLERSEELLLLGFNLCENLWTSSGFDKVKVHETDTYNKEDRK
jgi:hypothetical protein